MAKSIGYEVIGIEAQNRRTVHGGTCVGPGKLEEIKKLVDDKSVQKVIFANALSSSKIFRIQKVLGRDINVIDRNLLILEVFDKRAMTTEAKLQIELARLKYTFSWGREFIKAGGLQGQQVGWGGPGEYPYFDYEREYRKRISHLELQLRDLYTRKDNLRERRHAQGFLVVALAGYTQSGKTTFFNRLSREKKTIGLGPFTTLSTSARRITVQDDSGNKSFILVDSIGFIEDMDPIILDAFNTTLGEIIQADIILLFIDVSEDLSTIRRKLVTSRKIIMQTDIMHRTIICANKVDTINEEALDNAEKEIEGFFPALPIVAISASTGKEIDKLLSLVVSTLGNVTPSKYRTMMPLNNT
ncbi:MAG: GTPase HflX [Thermoproteota archaeon]|nr:GTPase HflX [Thermoproteota archaeon]